jgi:hypothetical protein
MTPPLPRTTSSLTTNDETRETTEWDGVHMFAGRGKSAGSRRCSFTAVGTTSSTTCCPCDQERRGRIRPAWVSRLLPRRRSCRDHHPGGHDAAVRHREQPSDTQPASGAIAAVLGAVFSSTRRRASSPSSCSSACGSRRGSTSAWFLYQLIEADVGLYSAAATAAPVWHSSSTSVASSLVWVVPCFMSRRACTR